LLCCLCLVFVFGLWSSLLPSSSLFTGPDSLSKLTPSPCRFASCHFHCTPHTAQLPFLSNVPTGSSPLSEFSRYPLALQTSSANAAPHYSTKMLLPVPVNDTRSFPYYSGRVMFFGNLDLVTIMPPLHRQRAIDSMRRLKSIPIVLALLC